MASFAADDVIRLYGEAKALRNPHESDWRVAAAHCIPWQYAGWLTEGPATYNRNMAAARRVAYDTTAARSLQKYMAILERLVFPSGMKWHGLTPSDQNLRKSARVRSYFEDLTGLLFRERYHPKARFRISASEMFMSMGVYGNGPLFIGGRAGNARMAAGIKYVSCNMRDVFMMADDEGNVVAVFRRFWLNARQFKMKFPDVPPPDCIKVQLDMPVPSEDKYFEFVHYVAPNDDHDPEAFDERRHPWSAVYVCVEAKAVIGEKAGFRSMPYKVPRTSSVAGDAYGYSPAVMAYAAIGGASQMKKTYLKQGNKAVDPPMLTHNDAVANGDVDIRPGAINPGYLDRQGRELAKPMRGGDFRVAEVLLQDERRDIEDSFFVTLFQILTDTPEMTATEVMERVAEKAALLAPTMGRLHSELAGPMIEREIDIHGENGKLPQMPPELVEAAGEYEVVYTSPLAKSMYAEEVSGFMRAVEMSLNIAQATQDMSHLDHYDFDTALPEIADHMAVPARWMKTIDAVKETRGQRQTQMQEQQLLEQAPAIASAASTVSKMQQGGGK